MNPLPNYRLGADAGTVPHFEIKRQLPGPTQAGRYMTGHRSAISFTKS